MEYSVEDISKLARVSVRTLHYYDEIGLLKPTDRKSNGRRYYGQEQLIKLIEILFLKKFGFNLKKIASMLNLGNKDKRALMIAKKELLKKEIQRIKDLIKSIDITLEFYYKGENINYNQIIKQFELFQKTTKEDKQRFEEEFGALEDEEIKKIKKMSLTKQQEYYENMMSKMDHKLFAKRNLSWTKKIVEAVNNNKKEDSKEVQDLMKEYFEILNMACPISKKKWLGMGIFLCENKDSYITYAKMHPKLPEFLAKAIKIYGDNLVE